jgi:ribosomal protein S20
MPIIKSAIKRMKQTIKRNERNVGIKREIKDATKSFLAKPSSEGLSKAHSELDTAVKKGLLKKNTVARRKAQLAKVAKDAGVKLALQSLLLPRNQLQQQKLQLPKPLLRKKLLLSQLPKRQLSNFSYSY